MAGTREGGRKARDKNLAKNPNFYRDIGRIGGMNGFGGGFASELVDTNGLTGPQRARKYGRIGGTKSRRRKRNEQELERNL